MYRYSNPNRLPVQAVVAAWKWFVRKRAVRLPIGAVELQLKVRGTLSREAADRLHITADGLAPMTAWFNWVFPSLATLRARQTTSKGCIMTGTRAAHPSVEERRARGKLARKQATPTATSDGDRLRIDRTRWVCSKNRTPPAKPTWYRYGTDG
jgi:hypothetical protein